MEEYVVNLSEDETFLEEGCFIIDESIESIWLTSEGAPVKGNIYVAPRNHDLKITIQNLFLDGEDDIAFDLRQGNSNSHSCNILFQGKNEIISQSNIAVAITNGQSVILQGDKGELCLIGGNESPAIGNDRFCAGSIDLTMCGTGYITIKGRNRKEDTSGMDGAPAIQCYQGHSNLLITGELDVLVQGGNGEPIRCIRKDCRAGSGGDAIHFESTGRVTINSSKKCSFFGGKGSCSCREAYVCNQCGNGGNAISMLSGILTLSNTCSLYGGAGGGIDCECSDSLEKGGNGGDCIYLIPSESGEDVKINLADGVHGRSGDGGTSGGKIKSDGIILGQKSGNGGCFINGNHRNFTMKDDHVIFEKGKGGERNCSLNESLEGMEGLYELDTENRKREQAGIKDQKNELEEMLMMSERMMEVNKQLKNKKRKFLSKIFSKK